MTVSKGPPGVALITSSVVTPSLESAARGGSEGGSSNTHSILQILLTEGDKWSLKTSLTPHDYKSAVMLFIKRCFTKQTASRTYEQQIGFERWLTFFFCKIVIRFYKLISNNFHLMLLLLYFCCSSVWTTKIAHQPAVVQSAEQNSLKQSTTPFSLGRDVLKPKHRAVVTPPPKSSLSLDAVVSYSKNFLEC